MEHSTSSVATNPTQSHEQFAVGDAVAWTSNGREKAGRVYAIVPPDTDPRIVLGVKTLAYVQTHRPMFDGNERWYTSYLVEVESGGGRPALYWPLPKNLRRTEQAPPASLSLFGSP